MRTLTEVRNRRLRRPSTEPDAGRTPASTPERSTEDRLFTKPFVGVLAIALLGFGIENILRTVLPLIILDRGGDAFVVGLVATAAALPSVLLRPMIGRLIDTWRHDVVLRIGTLVLAVGTPFFFLPGLVLLTLVRFLHGFGWAMYSVANHAMMAKLAPSGRRGEASGYFMAMPAVATLAAPAIGVTLYLSAGTGPPLLFALVLGTIAFGITLGLRIPQRPVKVQDAEGGDDAASDGRILERSALPSTLMVTTFMSAQSLFLVFPPVYFAQVGAPLEVLAIYYPIYGLAKTVGQLVVGRSSDSLGRTAPILLGCTLAVIGLSTVFFVDPVLALFIASIAYAAGMAFVGPTLSALTIDRAPEGRLGAALATYTVGYQLATGASGIVWGSIITMIGYPWPFAFAILLQVLTLGLGLRFGRPKAAPSESPPSATA